jgi:hypothetical protein
MTLNYTASKLVNFDVIRFMILRADENEKITVHTEKKIKRKRAGILIDVITEAEDKMYRVSFINRRRLSNNTSVPLGYIDR